ncbi:MAG: hypothetical protein ACYTAN_14645 [Planctomycetota bacterium]|jgi:hypothetical protein
MRTGYAICAVLLLAMMAVGCGREEPDGPTPPEPPGPDVTADFDGDGLADVDEIEIYHTSPETMDTDGDGYDDYRHRH